MMDGEHMPAAARTAEGVYYSRDDYAGFWRRVCVDLIDLAFFFVAFMLVATSLMVFVPGADERAGDIVFGSVVAIWFLYLILLKRSSFGTLGYRIARVRIVTLQGSRPGIWALMKRSLFLFIGPLNLLVDITWIPGDAHRQALRDKFARTYVIRDHAVPAGHAPIGYATYTLMGNGFLFAEVKPPRSPALRNP